jgi:hypothetical protein
MAAERAAERCCGARCGACCCGGSPNSEGRMCAWRGPVPVLGVRCFRPVRVRRVRASRVLLSAGLPFTAVPGAFPWRRAVLGAAGFPGVPRGLRGGRRVLLVSAVPAGCAGFGVAVSILLVRARGHLVVGVRGRLGPVARGAVFLVAQRMGPGGFLPGSGFLTRSSDHLAWGSSDGFVWDSRAGRAACQAGGMLA